MTTGPWTCLIAFAMSAMTIAFTTAEAQSPGASPKINDRFIDPDLDVGAWVETFEGESREVFTARFEILAATALRPGARVADIGAGTGLYTRLFAREVGPRGWVYAVEISPRFLEHINDSAAEAGLANVTAILGRTDDTTLPIGAVDVVFMCDTYHHFEAVDSILASIRRALIPGGILVVVDFERIPGESREWTLDHVRAGKGVFRAEIEAAGFALVEETEIDGLEENYFLKFKKN